MQYGNLEHEMEARTNEINAQCNRMEMAGVSDLLVFYRKSWDV